MTSFLSDSKTNTKDPFIDWRQLTLNVKANPNNLGNHTQRIMLAMDIHLQPYLSGAFQDFFITLKETGRPLKEKMFHLASPLLEGYSRDYFLQWLEQETDANLDCMRFPGSALISTSCKKTLTTKSNDEEDEASTLNNFLNENYDNPIDKAHYCVAYGCIEEAQKLLELEILKHEKRQPSIEAELLYIYYHSQDKKALDEMSQKLLKVKKSLSKDWQTVQNFAKDW